MTDDMLLPFDLPAVDRKKFTVDFNIGSQSSDAGLLLLNSPLSAVEVDTGPA
jgi:hypothetical protein